MGNPLNYVYEFVAWVLRGIYGVLAPLFGQSSGWTWALSIVILVVLMRLILVPLFIKQMHTSRAMASLAPQIAALRKKYKDDKQTLQQETMKLYQEAGVNPLMGCLPVVLQLPLFFGLFNVLKAIAEWKPGVRPQYGLTHQMVQSAQHAKILGATVADKVLFTGTLHVSLTAKLVILVAVLISMTTTFLTVRQSQKRGMMPAATPDNPMASTQKYMTYIMPLFALSGLYWQFGLVLYWVTTNVWTLGQQWVLLRRYPQTAAAGGDAGGAGAQTPAASGTGAAKAGTGAAKAAANVTKTAGNAARAAGNGTKAAANGTRAAGSGSKAGSSASRVAASGSKPGGGVAKSAGSASAARGGARGVPQGARLGGARIAPVTAGSAAGPGILRRLGKRAEPEPEPVAEPEIKIVRQQRQRQSRSKRSGKH